MIVYECTDGAAFDCCWQHIKKLSTLLKEGPSVVLTADLLDDLLSVIGLDTLLCLSGDKSDQKNAEKPES